MVTLLVIFKIAVIFFTADLFTGVFHFWMDVYGRLDMPILGKYIVEPNLIHHKTPRKLIKNSYISLTYTSYLAGILFLLILFIVCGYMAIRWEMLLMVFYASNANLIHKWSHQTEKENGRFISFFQKIGLFQSRKHHGWHHKAPFDTNYCILSDWLNPILNKIYFWESIVWFFKKIGINPVSGSEVRDFV